MVEVSAELELFIIKLTPGVIVPTDKNPTVPPGAKLVKTIMLVDNTEVVFTVTVPAARIAVPDKVESFIRSPLTVQTLLATKVNLTTAPRPLVVSPKYGGVFSVTPAAGEKVT